MAAAWLGADVLRLFEWGGSRLAWFGDANGRGLPFYSLPEGQPNEARS